jgi:hypothetical protein
MDIHQREWWRGLYVSQPHVLRLILHALEADVFRKTATILPRWTVFSTWYSPHDPLIYVYIPSWFEHIYPSIVQ